MKKILSFIVAFMALTLPMSVHASDDKSTPQPITLSSHADNNKPNPKPRRAQMRIPVEAWYEADTETISIIYYGDATGEVNLYLNGQLIESSFDINTTFTVSEAGFYTIEIKTESWTATGSIEI